MDVRELAVSHSHKHGQGLPQSPHTRECVTEARVMCMARACLNRPTRECISEARDMCIARACLNRPTRECINEATDMCTHMFTPQTHATYLDTTPKAHGKVRSHNSHGAEWRVR